MLPFAGVSIWFVAKIFVLFALSLYIVFSLVLIRQVQLMTDTLETGFETPLRILSWGHFIFAVSVLAFALFVL